MTTVKANPTRLQIFTAPAKAEAKKLLVVQKQLDAFVADGKVTAAEKKQLKASIATARRSAEPLVAAQSNTALEALRKVELMTDKGTLTQRAQVAVDVLREARSAIVKNAKFAAEHSPFRGKEDWKKPFHGVRTKDFTVQGLEVHAVAIDLADPRVTLQTNSEAARGKTPETQARNHHAEVAINGDFYSFGSFKPSGFAMSQGKTWANTSDRNFEGFLAFTGHHAELMSPFKKNPAWSRNAVSARPTVLIDGKPALSDPNKNDRTARTGLGVSKTGRVVYLVAVEGKSGVKGLTATELGSLLKRLGADDGLAMDSGGSAQMYVRGRGLVQKSTDPLGFRGAANVLMVQAG